MDKKKRSFGVKKYICYVAQRCKYIEHGYIVKDCDEYHYYRELLDEIISFFEEHKILCWVILGKIKTKEVRCLLGVNERQMFRLLAKQREELIALIEEKERELSEKYPFEE